MNSWALALLPLLGVILGATLQFWLSRASERNKRIESLQADAYSDYLRAVAASAHLQSDDDLVSALKAAADAKSRIVVYGSRNVIAAIAEFERVGPTLGNAKGVAAFMDIVVSMRDSVADVSPRDIAAVLVGYPNSLSEF